MPATVRLSLLIVLVLTPAVHSEPPEAPTPIPLAPRSELPTRPEKPVESPPLAETPVEPPAPDATVDGEACKPFDWSKVPSNLRPLPRVGWFAILPDRPGYYSVADVFRGRFRDAPPKTPYAPLSASAGAFFDADYRYLDDPSYADSDWLDCLKRRHCGDEFMLSTGGEFRYRLMNETGSRLTAVQNDYHLIRTRVWGDVWYLDRLRYYVEFIDAHAFNESLPPLAIDNNNPDFLNMFVDVKVFDRLGAPAYVRIGRQELIYGSQRLISPLDWANTRRTFQGVKLLRSSDKWDFDLFWVKPVPVDAVRLDWWDYNRNFTGVWATYKPKKGTTRDFYVLNLHQTLPLVPAGGARAAGPLDLTTFGTRWAGD